MVQVSEQAKVRQSVTFTKEQHAALQELADCNDVSFCWVVRHACKLLLIQSSQKKNLIDLSLAQEDNELSNVR